MLSESTEKGNLRRDMTGECPLWGPGETDGTILTSTAGALLAFAPSFSLWLNVEG
jgi:hypothetical protein